MRELFTAAEAEARGITRAQLRTGKRNGRWVRVDRTVYGLGAAPPSPIDRRRAAVLATGGVACGTLAGVLRGYDGVVLGDDPGVTVPMTANARRPGVRRRALEQADVQVVAGLPCTSPLLTLLDLAAVLDDDRWEQALESALRRDEVTLLELRNARGQHRRGSSRIGRVLGRRPVGAPPTESLLETLMVQLVRLVPGLPAPVRQYRVIDRDGVEVARVDLCWPELGLFIELDGQHHRGQPLHDSRRETAVVAATGWLCGRFTWHEVARLPHTTARRLAELVEQARRRPLPA